MHCTENDRRAFLKTVAAAAAGMALPGLSAAQREQAVRLTDPADEHFSLRKIAPVVAEYALPTHSFNPSGRWQHTYRMYSVASVAQGTMVRLGKMQIQRTHDTNGTVLLEVSARRRGQSDYFYLVEARLECHEDVLTTPKAWQTTSKMARSFEEEAYLKSGIKESATVKGDQLVISGDTYTQRLDLPATCTTKWGLMDAVQRISQDPKQDGTIAFSIIDGLDELRNNQVLAFRKQVSVRMRSKTRQLTAHIHFGAGEVPTLHWTDEQGRLLFVVAGTRVLVLKKAGRLVAHYPERFELD